MSWSSCVALVGLVALLLPPPVDRVEGWARARSPHFEVLSDAGAAPAGAAARRLEALRDVLLQLFPPREELQRPITLLVIESPARFSTLLPRSRSGGTEPGGFFQSGTERDYAVLHLSPDGLRPFEAGEHEYAHLVLNTSLPAQPVWVAEGLADLLSDAVLDRDEARLGAARPAYEALLRDRSRPALERLLVVGYDSPEYRGEGDAEILYACSWALVRWVVHRRGLDGLRSFLEAIAAGTEPVDAFVECLGRLAEAEATLLDVPPGPLLRVPLSPSRSPAVEVDVPSTADVDQRLGDVLFHGGHSKAAERHFERALLADPGHAATRSSLAGLLVRQGKWSEARRQVEALLAARPEDPVALLRLVRLRLGEATDEGVPLTPVEESRLVAALETALAGAPQLHQAALLLAHLRPEPLEERISFLQPLFDQRPERTEVAQVLSQLHLKNGDLDSARRVLERARDATHDPTNRYLADRQLARLETFSVATAEVRGDLVHVDCRPDGSLRFTVVADPRTVKLEAESTRSFLVHGEEEEQAELLCGPQDRSVAVRYTPGASANPDLDGVVLWLSFDED